MKTSSTMTKVFNYLVITIFLDYNKEFRDLPNKTV